jgi:site-specific recombinase XerC
LDLDAELARIASLTIDQLRDEWQERLGHDKQVVPHVLRHTCATRLSKAKTDPLRMQEWLGHSTLQMTARYTHLDVSDLRIGATALER